MNYVPTSFKVLLILFLHFPKGTKLKKSQLRLTGGSYVAIKQLPYMAEITFKNKRICSAGIIAPNFVVTSASCFRTKEQSTNQNLHRVIVGSTISQEGKSFKVARIAKSYLNNNTAFSTIALVKIMGKFSFGPTVKAVRMEKKERAKDVLYQNCFLAGWETKKKKSLLQVLRVKILSYERCRDEWPYMDKSVMCGFPKEDDAATCSHDLGSPLVCEKVLVGVLAMGANTCIPDVSDQFTRIGRHASFIEKAMTKKRQKNNQAAVSTIYFE